MLAIISIIESMKRGRPELVARGGWCCVAWPVVAGAWPVVVVAGLCLWCVGMVWNFWLSWVLVSCSLTYFLTYFLPYLPPLSLTYLFPLLVAGKNFCHLFRIRL